MAARYGADTAVLDWRERLVRSRCGSRQVDMVVSGTRRHTDRLGTPEIAPAPARHW
jgi:hypothetical protein